MKLIPALHIALLTAPLAMGQLPNTPTQKGEFPGLGLLPPGSVVSGITLPRYEKHRVSTQIMAKRLEVVDAHRVKLSGIRTSLYKENGEITDVELETAEYNFKTEMMISNTKASMRNPHFSARGSAVTFSHLRQQGLLRGPVHTTLNTADLAKPTDTATP